MNIGYKDDTISLITAEGINQYRKIIPPIPCWWMILSPTYKFGIASPGLGNKNYPSDIELGKYRAVRPILKYATHKTRIIESSDQEDIFFFNNYPFKIIDEKNEIAIALIPIAFEIICDERSFEYETSSVRSKLFNWRETGIWNNNE